MASYTVPSRATTRITVPDTTEIGVFSGAVRTVIHVVGSGLNQPSATISELRHEVEYLREMVRRMRSTEKTYVEENTMLRRHLFELQTDTEAIMDCISHMESELQDLKEKHLAITLPAPRRPTRNLARKFVFFIISGPIISQSRRNGSPLGDLANPPLNI
ncbi:hypothetical protein MPER_09996 [Moniliophthora perniciosa FA553]|nr:hypothetical protein MPER_09996 [Moniliophthora perniciosa FA553]